MQKLNRDALFMLPRDRVATLAHEALFPINNLEGHEMVAALSILFAAVCHRCRIDPHEAHTLGLRMLRDEDFHKKANDQLQSLRDFAAIRVGGEQNVGIA